MSVSRDWLAAINSRFVTELLEDSLPTEVLTSYLIQDFTFFNQGIMEHAISLAPNEEIRSMLAAQSKFFETEEEPYFRHFLKEYGISDEQRAAVPQTPANKDYCEYLDKLVRQSWPMLLSALCCMEWIYLAWAKRTTDAKVTQSIPAHSGWVNLHEGELFRTWVAELITLVNRYVDPLGSEAEVFTTIVHLERRFFDDSYYTSPRHPATSSELNGSSIDLP